MEALTQETLAHLNEVAGRVADFHEAEMALREGPAEDLDIEQIGAFRIAFGYMLHLRSESDPENDEGPFGSMWSGLDDAGNHVQFPPPLSEVPAESIALWRAAYGSSEAPILRARLGDLLFVRKDGDRPDIYARGAIDGIIEIAGRSEPHRVERAQFLARALELALLINDRERLPRVVSAMAQLVEEELADPSGPGAPLRVLRPLSALDAEDRPESMLDLVERVSAEYGEDPYIADAIAEIRSDLAEVEQREPIQRAQVEKWIAAAEEGDTMLRVNRLERALELAGKFGFRDLVDSIRVELGRIRPEDLELGRISSDISIGDEELEEFLNHFRDAGDLGGALARLAAEPPPHGSQEKLEQRLDEIMREAPIQFLITRSLIGPDNATAIFRGVDEESRRRMALAEQQSFGERMWGLYAAQALLDMEKTFGRPSHEALTEMFSGGFTGGGVAERFARSLELFWDGQFDEAGHIVVPRIERVFRDLARAIGVPVVREQRGPKPGGVVTLGILMAEIKPAFRNEALHSYYRSVLVDPLGLNLRNKICHGLIDAVGPYDVALLIQIAKQLGDMSIGEPERPE